MIDEVEAVARSLVDPRNTLYRSCCPDDVGQMHGGPDQGPAGAVQPVSNAAKFTDRRRSP